MRERTYTYQLDLYYLATIVYGVTFVVYVAVRGSLSDGTFAVVLRDPIVYLLGLCSVAALLALVAAAVLQRRVIIHDRELVFRTRFKTRVFLPEDIEQITFGPARRVRIRGEEPDPDARIKLRTRRRRLRLYASSFEHSEQLMNTLAEWAAEHQVPVKYKRGGKAS